MEFDISPYVEDRLKVKNIYAVFSCFPFIDIFEKVHLHLQDRLSQGISSELESYYKAVYSIRENAKAMGISLDRASESMIQKKICLISRGRKSKHL